MKALDEYLDEGNISEEKIPRKDNTGYKEQNGE